MITPRFRRHNAGGGKVAGVAGGGLMLEGQAKGQAAAPRLGKALDILTRTKIFCIFNERHPVSNETSRDEPRYGTRCASGFETQKRRATFFRRRVWFRETEKPAAVSTASQAAAIIRKAQQRQLQLKTAPR